MKTLANLFEETFEISPEVVVRAPGRVELLGNHTDYNEGYVMALAVDRFVTLAASPRSDSRVEVVSDAFPDRAAFDVDSIEKDPNVAWVDYVKGLLQQLSQRGLEFGGFNAAIHSTIPLGGGLSSSAALLVSTALAVRQMYPYRLTPNGSAIPEDRLPDDELPALGKAEKLALAKVCQAAENEFVGVNCGLLDYIASLFGRTDHTVLIDFRDLSVDVTPFDPELAVVVCPSGVKHELVAGEYNERRELCESAARKFGVPALRDLNQATLDRGRAALSDREHGCAAHIVGENDRVLSGSELLRRGDFNEFGRLMFQSHASSRELFQNSCPELDALVEIARQQGGCVGARLTGGGFGGATLNLVQRKHVEDFKRAVAEGYGRRTGRALEPLICQVTDGAQ